METQQLLESLKLSLTSQLKEQEERLNQKFEQRIQAFTAPSVSSFSASVSDSASTSSVSISSMVSSVRSQYGMHFANIQINFKEAEKLSEPGEFGDWSFNARQELPG